MTTDAYNKGMGEMREAMSRQRAINIYRRYMAIIAILQRGIDPNQDKNFGLPGWYSDLPVLVYDDVVIEMLERCKHGIERLRSFLDNLDDQTPPVYLRTLLQDEFPNVDLGLSAQVILTKPDLHNYARLFSLQGILKRSVDENLLIYLGQSWTSLTDPTKTYPEIIRESFITVLDCYSSWINEVETVMMKK